MKKFITLTIAALTYVIVAQAQTTSTPAIDTIVTSSSADTANLIAPSGYFKGADGTFSVSVVGTKIGGTVNAIAILQSSVDGVNYKDHYGTSADTFSFANASGAQVHNWYVSGAKPTKVRIRVLAPSSTQSLQVKGFFVKQ